MPVPRTTRAPRKASTRRPGKVQGKKSGERTAQLLHIADATWWSLVLLAEQRSLPERPMSIGEVLDTALQWFLTHRAAQGYEAYLANTRPQPKARPFWIDSRLLGSAARVAERDNVSRNRVIYTAFVLYLKEHNLSASAADIARLKQRKAQAGGRAWRVTKVKR